MSDVTRRGVYKDLSKSPYQLAAKDLIGRPIIYKFSSQFKMEKFDKECLEAAESLNKCLGRVFGDHKNSAIFEKLMNQFMFYHYKEFKQ